MDIDKVTGAKVFKALLSSVENLDDTRQDRRRFKINIRFICDLDPPEKYQCEKCSLQYDLKVLLIKHFDTVHETKATQHYINPTFRYCKNCGFHTFSLLIFLNHKTCCDRNENYSSLEDVKEFKNENSENNSHVQACGTTQNVVERLRAKIKKSLESEEGKRLSQPNQKKIRRLQCAYCSYMTYTHGYLKNHIKMRHSSSSEINWLKCDHCPYNTIRSRNLKAHIRQLHTPSEQTSTVKCENLIGHNVDLMHTPTEQINWLKCEH